MKGVRNWIGVSIYDFPKHAQSLGFDVRVSDFISWEPIVLALMEEINQLRGKVDTLERLK